MRDIRRGRTCSRRNGGSTRGEWKNTPLTYKEVIASAGHRTVCVVRDVVGVKDEDDVSDMAVADPDRNVGLKEFRNVVVGRSRRWTKVELDAEARCGQILGRVV